MRIPLISRARRVRVTGPDGSAASGRDDYPDIEKWAWEIIEAVGPFTMTSPERLYALLGAVDYVVGNAIPGAVVECGVWRGGSMLAAATRLQQLGAAERDLYLFDTFEGMPAPTADDSDLHGAHAEALLAAASRESAVSGEPNVWCVADISDVRATMARSGYRAELCHYVVGDVEQTVPGEAPAEIALLRLDTDWHRSTRHELNHLYDRLQPGGVLLIDDYGHWQGARRATDEFFRQRGIRPLLQRIDYTGRLHVKPGH